MYGKPYNIYKEERIVKYYNNCFENFKMNNFCQKNVFIKVHESKTGAWFEPTTHRLLALTLQPTELRRKLPNVVQIKLTYNQSTEVLKCGSLILKITID